MKRWFVLLTLTGACGPGVCEGTGGEQDTCYEGWTPEECESFDRTAELGADWRYSASGTCGDRGYTFQCRETFLPADAICALQD